MSRRSAACSVLLALLAVLCSSAAAYAKFRGTDMWSNLMPPGHGLADRYPLSHYALDYYVDGPSIGAGGVSTGDPMALVAQFLAAFTFSICALAMRTIIAVFDWAFSLDLVTGSDGLLGLSSTIAQGDYTQIVKPLLVVAVIALGIWMLFKLRVTREQSNAGSAIMRVVVLTVVAIAIISHPQETVGRAYQLTDDVAVSIISNGRGAQSVSDDMFNTFVYRNWAIMQFSGVRVCTGAKTDDDGFPLAATAGNPAKVCHDVLRKDADGHGDYARRFVRWAPGSDERKAEYDALREGKAPVSYGHDAQFSDVEIDRTDAPAVDLMQAGGAGQRLLFMVPIGAGVIFAFLLIALITIGIVFAQLVIAALFLAAPFMVIVAVYPPWHGVVQTWLTLMGKMLISKIVLSVLLKIVTNTSTGLAALASHNRLAYLLAFVLQAVLYGGVFIKRKAIIEKISSSKTAEHYSKHENSAVSFAAGATTATLGAMSGGAGKFAQTMRQGWNDMPTRQDVRERKESQTQEHSPSRQVDSSSPPASAGREYSPTPELDPSAPRKTIEDRQMPTSTFNDDLERERQSRTQPGEREPVAASNASAPAQVNGVNGSRTREVVPIAQPATQHNFADHLRALREQERVREREDATKR